MVTCLVRGIDRHISRRLPLRASAGFGARPAGRGGRSGGPPVPALSQRTSPLPHVAWDAAAPGSRPRRNSQCHDRRVDPLHLLYAGHHEYDVVGGSPIKATLSIHNPYLAAGDHHSLSEVLAGDEDASHRIYNTAEADWTVDPRVFGSTATRLFVYARLAGYSNPTCYPGDVVGQGSCGWVQVNSYVKPGDLLPTQNGSSQTFQLIRSNRGWEVYYWYFNVGYFQNAWYGLSGDGFGSATIWDWYGEVAAPYHTGGSCTDMGDGLPASSAYAAYQSGLAHTDYGHGPLTADGPYQGIRSTSTRLIRLRSATVEPGFARSNSCCQSRDCDTRR